MSIGGIGGYSSIQDALYRGAGAGVRSTGLSENSPQMKALKHSGQVECETCKSRKYKDGSNEGDVSFKAAAHIDPSSSASTVMAHEQEHVANARQKTSGDDAQLVGCSVTLKTAVCPECGRSYVAGGVTNTAIKYKQDDAYSQNQKKADYPELAGKNVDKGL